MHKHILKTVYHTPKLTLKIIPTHTHTLSITFSPFVYLSLGLTLSHEISLASILVSSSLFYLSLSITFNLSLLSLSHTHAHSIPLSRSLSLYSYICASMCVCVCVDVWMCKLELLFVSAYKGFTSLSLLLHITSSLPVLQVKYFVLPVSLSPRAVFSPSLSISFAYFPPSSSLILLCVNISLFFILSCSIPLPLHIP